MFWMERFLSPNFDQLDWSISVGNIEGICGRDCQCCHGYCCQGVDGKYIHVLPLTDGHSPREFRIDASVGMHTSVTAFLACQ